MNEKRRKKLRDMKALLKSVQTVIQSVLDEEEDAFGNMPESLQYSEKGDKMEEGIGNLEDLIGTIDDAIDYIDDIVG